MAVQCGYISRSAVRRGVDYCNCNCSSRKMSIASQSIIAAVVAAYDDYLVSALCSCTKEWVVVTSHDWDSNNESFILWYFFWLLSVASSAYHDLLFLSESVAPSRSGRKQIPVLSPRLVHGNTNNFGTTTDGARTQPRD
jgi:hypothetical protein